MNTASPGEPASNTRSKRLAVAIVAMGGQGGGVLSDWLRVVAESQGWLAQTTSVPGVAQRTGATIYYLEMFKPDPPLADGSKPRDPVLALMPVAGDVDLVIAAEWMETGRAMMRGLVTPDRTTLIASTHRSYATVEKIVPGDGIADPQAIVDAAQAAAKKLIAFDMAAIADAHNSVISAALLGAIAASGALPFELGAFEAAIKSGGVGVQSSLKAFAGAYDFANAHGGEVQMPDKASVMLPSDLAGPLGDRIKNELAQAAWPFAFEGVRRCIDFQDGDYASDYLNRIKRIADLKNDPELVSEVARWLALRMCYEDPIRVADLKLRGERTAQIRSEVKAAPKQVIHHTEYLHPRVEEIADSLPAAWGQRLLNSPRLRTWVDRSFGKGRTIRTSSLSGFVVMYLLAGASRWRRGSLRHGRELASIDQWLDNVARYAKENTPLAIAVARLARVLKGYGDTHTRGMAVYTRLSGIAEGLAQDTDGGQKLEGLLTAALADASGKQLDQAVAAVIVGPNEVQAANAA